MQAKDFMVQGDDFRAGCDDDRNHGEGSGLIHG